MKIAYFDCSSGISGDMTLGAIIDSGVELSAIQHGIDSLGLPSCQLTVEEVKRHGFRATKLTVRHEPEQKHRHLHHISAMIDGSMLSPRQKELANKIFSRLADAEAKVHGSTREKVHFHEVGAVDSIADIVGTAIGLDLLGVERIVCSPIPTGHGYIQIAHGRCSIPAPATAELLRGIPLAACNVEAELTTPTGAAIVASMVDQFGGLPPMTIESIGYGAGDKDFAEQGNILRLIVGSGEVQAGRHLETDHVEVLETNLDNVTGEIIGHTTRALMDAGAYDVFSTPIQMKKDRPATKLTVLCSLEKRDTMESILFHQTKTLGIRRWHAERRKLHRDSATVATRWGDVPGKRIVAIDGTVRFSPEFDACAKLALQHDVPVYAVIAAVEEIPSS